MSPTTRHSPIATSSQGTAGETLSHPPTLLKLGLKGPRLADWARQLGIELPAALYDVSRIGGRGLLARVGREEIILEHEPEDPLAAAMERAMATPQPDLYRIEQQSASFDLRGPTALGILAQTCAMSFADRPPNQIIYTRVAGVSCGVIILEDGGQRIYRLWVDYTLARYLWETLVEIAA